MGKRPLAASEGHRYSPNRRAGQSCRAEQAADIALGARLRAYAFDRYKTKRKDGERRPPNAASTLAVGDVAGGAEGLGRREAIADGVLLARDLVNEPANMLYPEEFAGARRR